MTWPEVRFCDATAEGLPGLMSEPCMLGNGIRGNSANCSDLMSRVDSLLSCAKRGYCDGKNIIDTTIIGTDKRGNLVNGIRQGNYAQRGEDTKI